MIYIYEIVRRREVRRGAVKHLEFPAGGDQRVIVTRVGTIKAHHLNTTILSYYYDLHSS